MRDHATERRRNGLVGAPQRGWIVHPDDRLTTAYSPMRGSAPEEHTYATTDPTRYEPEQRAQTASRYAFHPAAIRGARRAERRTGSRFQSRAADHPWRELHHRRDRPPDRAARQLHPA